MRKGDKKTLSTLRLISAAVKQKDIDGRPKGLSEGLSDGQIVDLLHTMIKQRRESADLYEKGARPDLAEKEKEEIQIILSYLPEQMDDEAIKKAVRQTMDEHTLFSAKDVGTIMGHLKNKYAGRMDFAKASGVIKANLL